MYVQSDQETQGEYWEKQGDGIWKEGSREVEVDWTNKEGMCR